MRFLIIGQGAREYALHQSIRHSQHVVQTAVCATSDRPIALTEQADICFHASLTDHASIVRAATENKISHVIIGPEGPLVDGLADTLQAHGMLTVGPGKQGAQLEGSKSWMKAFADRHQIPTARYASFDNEDEACRHVQTQDFPIVIKADGLAAGKGVTIATHVDEAVNAIKECMSDHRFGHAGNRVVIEEHLTGHEISFIALRDKNTLLPFGEARDHKRLEANDKGPNTGGMGCVSTSSLLTADERQSIMSSIVVPLHHGLAADNIGYQGVLFFGIMMTPKGPYLLEMNCRFGDPECQTLLLRFSDDLAVVLDHLARNRLASLPPLKWHDDPTISVVVARRGYPFDNPQTPSPIAKLQQVIDSCSDNLAIWHANTSRRPNGQWQGHTGRVLCVGARANSVAAAQTEAMDLINRLNWADGVFRPDIGHSIVDNTTKS